MFQVLLLLLVGEVLFRNIKEKETISRAKVLEHTELKTQAEQNKHTAPTRVRMNIQNDIVHSKLKEASC